jgi:hypothetical protein
MKKQKNKSTFDWIETFYIGDISNKYNKKEYEDSTGYDLKSSENKINEKKEHSTSFKKRDDIKNILEEYRFKLESKSQRVLNILKGIYNKNSEAAFGKISTPVNSHLLHLVSSVPMLVTAYRKIRSNKADNAWPWLFNEQSKLKLEIKQNYFLKEIKYAPDGISHQVFENTSILLRKGKYPWGESRRIYLEKPEKQEKIIPINIPPFMDIVVQSAIIMILEAIYEPWFEKRNRSFGFRPNKGVQDSIYCLTNLKCQGLDTAMQGNIKFTNDKVSREILIKILSRRIKDRKFLNLIKDRLIYQYYDTKKNKYMEYKKGILPFNPNKKIIDFQYLWNIYMMDFDEFVHTKTQRIFDELNSKVKRNSKEINSVYPNDEYKKLEKYRISLQYIIRILNKYPKDHNYLKSIFENKDLRNKYALKSIEKEFKLSEIYNNKSDLKQLKYNIMKELRSSNNKFFKQSTTKINQRKIRFIYSRYEEDWIILNNAPKTTVLKLKSIYRDFIYKNLKSKLSDEKIMVKDICKEPAYFLGFELHSSDNNKFIRIKNKNNIQNSIEKNLFALPDRNRLINHLHINGYCNEKGFPREIPKLSTLEPFIIIKRYNEVLIRLALFYIGFIKTPKKQIARWVYIIRYSCFKTLAQKYRLSIKKLMKKYGTNVNNTTESTVYFTVIKTIGEKKYKKTFRLLTLVKLIQESESINKKKKISNDFWSLEKGIIPPYNKENLKYLIEN